MHIRRAGLNDVSDIGDAAASANADDPLQGLRSFLTPYGYLYPEARRTGFVRRNKKRLYQGDDVFVMVSDPDDKDWDGKEHIMGFIATSGSNATYQQSWFTWLNLKLHCVEDSYRWYFRQDPSLDRGNMHNALKTIGETDLAGIAGLSGQKHHFCTSLAVAQEFQRRGVAKTLLKHIQSRAAAEGVPIILTSSIVAEKLYLSSGFREVGRAPLAKEWDTEPLLRWDP